jgi:hypothetical protein
MVFRKYVRNEPCTYSGNGVNSRIKRKMKDGNTILVANPSASPRRVFESSSE